jgi:iron complex outermembrane recepter protein
MKINLLILSLLFCSISFAQSTITGTVRDSKDQSVAGANVSVVSEKTATATDYDGSFSLKVSSLPATIKVSMTGFATKTVRVENAQKIVVVLQEEETKLNEIVVSASRAPERVLQSPVTIERMGQAQIKSTTAATFYDGLENLKEVQFNTSSFAFKSINTRGFATVANTRFLQLVDGMDNASPALNFVLGNLIGLSDIDVANVELLPGASSALYGANAFNGIMFMNSKNPFTNQGISTYLKGGQTTQDAAGTNNFWDFGIRAAHAFTKHFAGKANLTMLKASEWIANDQTDAKENLTGSSVNPNYDGVNVYGDEVSTNIKGVAAGLLAAGAITPAQFTAFNSILPNYNVARTGYKEQDLTDNKIKSVKADFSLYFRPWDNDIEIILQHKLGFGNTIYQGANRYSLKDFSMNQTKLEVKGKNFFVRGYLTDEDAGQSYDMRFAAWNVNRAWKADNVWFGQYAGTYVQSTLAGATPEQAHTAARNVADGGRFVPGTPQFESALASVISNSTLKPSSKFTDRSQIYHSDVNYNFKDLFKAAEIQVGGSARQYVLDSKGTIFTDFDGPLKYSEYGIYTQVQKKLMDEKLKFTGSIRYDKSKNFDGSFSPRISLVYSAGENKKHNFRASFQTGFRNPTTQDQYIGLDLGPFALIGSAPENLDRYKEIRNVSAAGQLILGNTAAVTLTGQNAYFNSYTAPSVTEFLTTGNTAKLVVATPGLVKPERVQAFDLGYRTVIKGDLSVDLSGYYNKYNDFINTSNTIAPYYGKVGTDFANVEIAKSAQALQNQDSRVYQVYTNSKEPITSIGLGIGLSKKVYKDFELGANYNYAEFKFDQEKDPGFEPSFNTPKHKLKATFGNQKLFKNFGFNTNVRWSTKYLWQSSFVDGIVPEVTVFDAQINYAIPVMKTVLKFGATNIGGKDYIQVYGAGSIGRQWFASITINP